MPLIVWGAGGCLFLFGLELTMSVGLVIAL